MPEMNCLVLSDTFPNAIQPWRGPYNRRQIECLAELCDVTVINPIPFLRTIGNSDYRRLVSQPDPVLKDIVIHHPVWWYLPVLGRNSTWRGVASAARRALAGPASGRYDVILATFAYPHGAAARVLSHEMGIPYVIKARGSDLHQLPRRGGRRDRAAEAVCGAAAVVAVSRELGKIAVGLGADPKHVTILPNGIDADRFAMVPRAEARRRLGVPESGDRVVFVGSLLPVKGVDVLLKAAERLKSRRNTTIILAGDGGLRSQVAAAEAASRGQLVLLGHVGRRAVADWLNAADVLVLPSRNEGCPNVVLEALCCGTPVVASRVGAVPDLLTDESGILVEPEDPAALAAALDDALGREWNRAALRKRVEDMSWPDNARRLHDVLSDVAKKE